MEHLNWTLVGHHNVTFSNPEDSYKGILKRKSILFGEILKLDFRVLYQPTITCQGAPCCLGPGIFIVLHICSGFYIHLSSIHIETIIAATNSKSSVHGWDLNICRLYHVDMELADERGSEPLMSSVEVCECPPGFDGFSCEVSYACSGKKHLCHCST